MMKTRSFVFVLLLCAQVIISVMTIDSSKEGKQFGATKESKTKFGIDAWRFTNWRSGSKPGYEEAKKAAKGSIVSGSRGNGAEGGAQGEVVKNVGEKEIESGENN
ncbi:uncharacterized protein LOC123911356 [Trifolium pratense]|uniref:uncharacterized protein LOC123911356 n=1 Tax=Trifolium pratense TaxID=57577 RepID=UPI001E6917BC|nr:uncharacterized protein LOC123911356 [Trifolium pratense]